VNIKKPEDEKYFKDITLNHILEEISQEDEKPIPDLFPCRREKKPKTKLFLSIVFFGILPVLLLVFFFTPSKTTDKQIIKNATISTVDTAPKKAVSTVQKEVLLPHKLVKPKKEETKNITIISKKPKPKIENIRDKAKNDLLKQMKI